MRILKIVRLLTVLLVFPFALSAQVTTSSISGIVKNKAGEALNGATLTVVHVPTGTVYSTSSRTGGRFNINNMNPGGPYRITTSFVGYETDVKEDIHLGLGDAFVFDVILSNTATKLTEVVVSSRKSALKTGTESTFNRERIENQPTVGRNIADYLRGTPQLKLSSGGSASSENAMSFAGQNVRYNSFYIDGAVNNDVFGLAYSGTNGGQSGIAPISMDAIDQFQVQISPYNVSLGNFTGGSINAVTKSGTNEFHGSLYYIFRNQDLSGKTPTGDKAAAKKVADFSNKTYGLTFGGPIVKNKIFYFISAEMQRDENPNPFTLSSYTGNTNTAAGIQAIVDVIKAKGGGYDPGGYENNVGKTTADRITAKIDWNISNKHKLALSYRYNSGERIVVFASSPTAINFYKSGYQFPTTTNSASAELKSTFGSKLSNRLLLTLTNVEDDRGPIGGGTAFPSVQIFDGTTQSIFFGTDASSPFNYLKQKTYNFVDHLRLTLGKNTLTFGLEAESYDAYNTFIQNTSGTYRYSTVADFLNDAKPNQYIAGFPLIGGTDEKNTDAAAKFKISKGAAFLNDEIRVNQNLTITAGIRFDKYTFITAPRYDQFSIDSALPKFAQYYDLRGAFPGMKPKVPVAFSPRLGFTYNIPEENVTIRGGLGLFAGRIPMVWPGGLYNNNGMSVGGYTLNSSTNAAVWNANLVRFRTTVYMPQEVGISLDNAKGQLNLISKEFKMPKVFRTSIAFDKRLGKGWSTSFETLVTKNVNDIYYQNINLIPPTLKMATGPDTRYVYNNPTLNIPIRASGANPYSGVYLIENSTGKKAFSYNFTLSVSKTNNKGFSMFTSYNYGESQVLNEAQSSTNSSQWSSQETVNGRNFVELSNSDNSAGHRIQSYVSKRFTYGGLNKRFSTTISLSYTGQSGQPFSYVYNGQAVRDGINGNDLIFIPDASQLQAMTFQSLTVGSGATAVTYTDVQQKAAFETFIQNDKYLRNHRGQYAERNGSRTPFTHNLDMKITQGFRVKVGGRFYAAEIGYSMFNFTNFLNRDWGKQYFQTNDSYSILGFSYTSASNLTPRYTFNPTTAKAGAVTTSLTPSYSSRWLSQLEFRIKF